MMTRKQGQRAARDETMLPGAHPIAPKKFTTTLPTGERLGPQRFPRLAQHCWRRREQH